MSTHLASPLAVLTASLLAASPVVGAPAAATNASAGEHYDFEDLLNIMVVSSTKTEQRLQEAPSIISVITDAQIRTAGYRSVAEALRHVPGVYVRDDLVQPNVSMRGVDAGLRAASRTIKVMINGRPVSYRSDGSNWMGPELIPISAVSRIEVIRGPGSALYGANAFLGVVNIVTKTAEELGGQLFVQGGGMQRPCEDQARCDANPSSVRPLGSLELLGTQRFELREGMPLEVLVAGSAGQRDRSGLMLPSSSPHFAQTGPRHASASPDHLASRNDLDRTYSLFGSAKLTAPKLGRLQLEGNLSGFDRSGEFTDWAVLTHDNVVSMQSWQLGASLVHALSEPLELTARLALSGGGTTPRNHLQISRDNSFWVRKDGGFTGYDAGLEARYTLSDTDSLTFGTTLSIDDHRLPSIYSVREGLAGDEAALPSYQLGERRFVNGGVFGQLVWAPFERLSTVAGLSFERHNLYGKQCHPGDCPGLSSRLGAVYSLFSNEQHAVYLKALYGGSFKAPPAELLFGTPYVISGIVGNRDLQPEVARSYELAVGADLFKSVSLLVNGFFTDLDGKVEYVQAGNFTRAMNSSDAYSAGVEASVQGTWKALTGQASVSYQKTWAYRCLLQDEGLCAQLREFNYLYPSLLGSVGASYRLEPMKTVLALSGTFVGARWSSLSNRLERLPEDAGAGYDSKAYELPAYLLLDASVTSRVASVGKTGSVSLSLSGRNLLNQEAAEPGFSGIDIPGLGRTVLLTAIAEM